MYTLGIAVLVIILEHAGGFSKAVGSTAKAYGTAYHDLVKV